MAGIFLKILNMSISASWIVLVVVLLRFVLKKAPKWINCVLWGVVGLRLIMPFSLESALSLIPSSETISKLPDSPRPHIDSGVTVIDNQINSYLQGNYFEGVTRPTGNFIDITTIISIIWIVGIIALLVYTLLSFLKLKSKIGTAVLLRDNIYQSENVISPFVLGVIKPKIYLPFNMGEDNMQNVIAHEQAHIKRKDYLWKPLGFLILTVYWFNPVMWLAYVLLCRDIELACDEKVVKDFDNEQKADYSEALLSCSVNRRIIAACPLAFGEVGVKNRVKSVLNYKKPAFWVIVVAIVASIITAVCFLTNPKTTPKEYYNPGYALQVVVESFKGTTQLPDKTETFVFEIHNGTTGELPNGTNFEIIESNLQEGSLTIQLTGEKLYSSMESDETVQEITVYENEKGVELTDDNYENDLYFITFSFRKTQSLDEAVSKAILEDNRGRYHEFGTECATEGHIIYDTDVDGNIYTVYVLTKYNRFGFMNGYFVSQSGGSVPAVMTFETDENGYALLNIKYAEDGSRYTSSIKEMFPKKYQYRVTNPTEKDYESLWSQCTAYAEAYLNSIGRTEEVRNYSQIEHISLTDVGVSVETSNKFCEYKNLPYNWDIGYYEAIENDIRYVYRTDYDAEQKVIVCTKEVYDTKEVAERIVFDGTTGEKLDSDTYVETIAKEEQNINFSWMDIEFPYRDKYTVIHYSTEDETENPGINIGEVYGEDLIEYLNSRQWKPCSAPRSELSSPGSVEFVVSDDCRITVYQKKNIFSKAYAVVTENGEKTYYKAETGDYASAKAILKAPDLTTSVELNNLTESDENKNPYLNAEVIEVNTKSILVKPDKGSNEIKSADKIYVSLDVVSEIPVPTIKVGDRVRVIYNGEIAETYPAQINNVFVIYLLGENDTVLSPTPLQ